MQPRPLTLEGRHVRLEPLARLHAPDLWLAADDAAIWDYMPVPRPRGPADVERLIAEALARQDRGEELPFAIVESAGGRAVGSTRYLDLRPVHRGLEIGWTWIGAAQQRTAVNTECKLLLLLAHAFEELGCLRVQLKTDRRNLRSQAAIERLGAVKEGVLRRHIVCPDGHVRDSVMYSITDGEWPAVRRGLEQRLARG